MKQWILCCVIAVFPLTGFAECDDLTPYSKAECLAAIEPARELEATYRQILERYDREEKTDATAAIKKAAVIAAQDAWNHFRDADCNAVSEQFHGGTGMLGAGINCATQHDKARTQQLRDEFVPRS